MRTSLSRVAVGGALLSLGLGLSACGASNEAPAKDSANGSSLSGNIKGAGSSAQEAAQGAWAAGFQTKNSGVTVDYAPDADVSNQPANSVIGDRSFSNDPAVVTTYAEDLARVRALYTAVGATPN